VYIYVCLSVYQSFCIPACRLINLSVSLSVSLYASLSVLFKTCFSVLILRFQKQFDVDVLGFQIRFDADTLAYFGLATILATFQNNLAKFFNLLGQLHKTILE
jgi:hypothetical protein